MILIAPLHRPRPPVSYVKALDIWMGSCTAFVFLALVEFTVVNHLARHHRRYLFWGSKYVHLSSSARECSDAPGNARAAATPTCYAKTPRSPSTPWPSAGVVAPRRRPTNLLNVVRRALCWLGGRVLVDGGMHVFLTVLYYRLFVISET